MTLKARGFTEKTGSVTRTRALVEAATAALLLASHRRMTRGDGAAAGAHQIRP